MMQQKQHDASEGRGSVRSEILCSRDGGPVRSSLQSVMRTLDRKHFLPNMQQHKHASIVRPVLRSSGTCLWWPLVSTCARAWRVVVCAHRRGGGAERWGRRRLRYVGCALLVVLNLYGYQIAAWPCHHVHALGGGIPLCRHAHRGWGLCHRHVRHKYVRRNLPRACQLRYTRNWRRWD